MLVLILLTGCASGSLLSDISNAVLSGKSSFGGEDVLSAPLNPNFQYLRVELTGAPAALLVLGYLDSHPQGDIEVWYSGKGEVLRLQNGRLIGSAGLAVDWRRMSFPQTPPAWSSVSQSGTSFTRIRDESPGYRLGLAQQVLVSRLSEPALKLAYDPGTDLAWFRETYSNASASSSSIPDAWFALGRYQGQNIIVFSRQCLSFDLCLTLQRWPLEKDRS